MAERTTQQLAFSYFRKRALTVDFAVGQITSDAGLLLIRQADDALRPSKRVDGSRLSL